MLLYMRRQKKQFCSFEKSSLRSSLEMLKIFDTRGGSEISIQPFASFSLTKKGVLHVLCAKVETEAEFHGHLEDDTPMRWKLVG